MLNRRGLRGGQFFGRTEDELRSCTAKALDENTDGYQQFHVHDQEVADLDTYRIASPLFTMTLPENNVLGAEPAVAEAVSEAYSFIIAPPPPGEYKIDFSTLASGPSEGAVASCSKHPKCPGSRRQPEANVAHSVHRRSDEVEPNGPVVRTRQWLDRHETRQGVTAARLEDVGREDVRARERWWGGR